MSCSSSQRQSKFEEQSLELRYGSNPPCDCFKKSQIRVVESERKPSKGKLYYCCPVQLCNFFRWCKPERAMWCPSGIPVNFTSDELDSKNAEEFEDVVSGVSGPSRLVRSHRRDDIRGNYVHFSWVISSAILGFLFFPTAVGDALFVPELVPVLFVVVFGTGFVSATAPVVLLTKFGVVFPLVESAAVAKGFWTLVAIHVLINAM
ncbi:hypothetical protein BUALT_BualtUnG0055800 [Buddleja alternifolia]|uniref:GRF-type domain-containing protein n=1 Tax=Buddleja alternifolia TaxID=168488 RepID=A0AAV6W345_9LAMI|nr:hypothetical protein BUALT_BualtUnG0055800 [Buddleja alternifolia]